MEKKKTEKKEKIEVILDEREKDECKQFAVAPLLSMPIQSIKNKIVWLNFCLKCFCFVSSFETTNRLEQICQCKHFQAIFSVFTTFSEDFYD